MKVHSRISPPGTRFVALLSSLLVVLESRCESLGITREEEFMRRLCDTDALPNRDAAANGEQ